MANLAKRPDGRWRARVVLADGSQRARHFARKVDAEQWLSEQVVKMRDGTWVDPLRGRRTFAEYAEGWFELQVHYRPSTRQRVRSLLHKHLIPQFGDMPLVAIQRSDVQAWIKTLSLTYRPATVEGLYRLLASILRSAVDDHVLTTTPCRKVRLPRQEHERVTVPALEDVAKVAAALDPSVRLIPAVAAGAGLRQGECVGLQVDRVDFLRRTIRVDQQLATTTGSVTLGPPKTRASIRTVPVPKDLVDALAAHLAAYPSDGFVFVQADGRPWHRQAWTRAWNAACVEAGVDVRFHDLRHLYASTLIDSGQSVVVVQERLGHASAKETLDTYSHLFPRDEDMTREAMTDVVSALVR